MKTLLTVSPLVVLIAFAPSLASAEPSSFSPPAEGPRIVEPTPAPVGPNLSTAPAAPDPYRTRFSMMAGLNQWILFGGGNVAAQLKIGRFAFEYSHGQSLHLDQVPALGLTGSERDAGAKVAMTWTTGGGFGVQITPNFHILVEAKAHRYEVRGAAGTSLDYTTFTVGPGIFYDIYLYKGLFLQPNVRWWPTVASTYNGKGTLARSEGGTYQHQRHDLAPFVNVNIGWTFDGR